MLDMKRQVTSIHFANSPNQSIYVFPTTAHTDITKVPTITSTLNQNVSSTIKSVISSSSPSTLSSSSPSSSLSRPSSSLSSTSTSSTTSTSSSSSMTTLSPTISPIGKSGSKLSTGAIAGIVVGGTCFLIAILLIAFLLFIRRRNAKKNRLSLIEKSEQISQIHYPNQKTTTISTITKEKKKPYETNSSSPTPLVNNNNINPADSPIEELLEDEMFWNLPPVGTFRVVSTYTQTLDDELYIQPGDKVQIYMEYDDGWCLGINLTRGGSRGVFPQHCINMERPL